MQSSLTEADYLRARRTLARRDPVLAGIMKKYGPCRLADRNAGRDPFAAVIQAIVSQQLSTKAADTIYRRFLALFPQNGTPGAREVLAADETVLRGVGLSRQKISYLRDLSAKVSEGAIVFETLPSLSDEGVIETLVRVKGIGRWSAEMFLIFQLRRPDVWPVDDLGIRKAVQQAYRLRSLPSRERLLRLGETWRPYRTVASWYLWASLDNKPAVGGDS
jgi:DNA-3-methyladenine glycosylase II